MLWPRAVSRSGSVVPEPDGAGEARDHTGDDPVGTQNPLQLSWRGRLLPVRPRLQEGERDSEMRFDLTPTLRRSHPVGRPRLVVDAHQPGSGQQRLARRAHTQFCGRPAPRCELLSPPLQVTIEVAVETASGTRVRRKRREPGGWIRPDKVDAVVTEEHLVPVRRVRVAVVVGRSGVGDLDASTPVGIGGRQASRQRVRAAQVDAQQVDVGRLATRIARGDRPVDLERSHAVVERRCCVRDDRLEQVWHEIASRAGPDGSVR